jgi:hypothetical protein
VEENEQWQESECSCLKHAKLKSAAYFDSFSLRIFGLGGGFEFRPPSTPNPVTFFWPSMFEDSGATASPKRSAGRQIYERHCSRSRHQKSAPD